MLTAPGSGGIDGSGSVDRTELLDITPSLEALQTDDQRLVLDTVAQVRKCGLESILSLPQLVVCGDQSAGKSSVLEALTEIPFPRNDNLCTRFATEIILRRAAADSLTIKVIPDTDRTAKDQDHIRGFSECITDFAELPNVMDKAMAIMGIDTSASGNNSRAFAKDVLSVLSVEIEGPSRPQLTLVDLPGLIQNETKGITEADIDLVKGITEHYISQPRTICLAVVSALNDYANQGIPQKVRRVDPEGERTLGIITKPDRLEKGSGSEKAFLGLARNNDIFFKLGWHVLKNRNFEEGAFSFQERNASETRCFEESIFKDLPKTSVGIDALRDRLSLLLFEHVKQELPKLRDDLEKALADATRQLDIMGSRRATPQECRDFLIKLSLNYYEVCKAAVNGNYEGDYFKYLSANNAVAPSSPVPIRRLRARVQHMNTEFSETMRRRGHRYYIDLSNKRVPKGTNGLDSLPSSGTLSRSQAFQWVSQALVRGRGRELPGNFNPLLIGELFWEQSSYWQQLAAEHMEQVADVRSQFLDGLLKEKCPKDTHSRLWASQIQDALKSRNEAASKELSFIMTDLKSYPINYNHYYTDTVQKRRREKEESRLQDSLAKATTHSLLPGCNSTHTSASIDVSQALENYHIQDNDPNMEHYSCEEILDGLLAIYKVCEYLLSQLCTSYRTDHFHIRSFRKSS